MTTVRIEDVAPVSVVIGNFSSTRSSFSNLLLFSETIRSGNRVDTFSSLTAMTSAGYQTTDKEYIAANAIFSQSSKDGKRVPSIKIGKKNTNQNCIQNVVFNADATAGTFTLTLGAETTSAIAYDALTSAVETAIEALTAVTSVTVTLNAGATNPADKEGFTIEFDGADANTDFALMTADVALLTGVSTGTITKTAFGSATEDWETAYAAIKAADNDFFVVIMLDKTKADILTVAATIESDETPRLGAFTTADADAKAGTAGNVIETMVGLNYEKSAAPWYSEDSTWGVAGLFGSVTPDKLYVANANYYPIVGLTPTTLTDTEVNAIITDGGNFFATLAGETVMPGTYAGQEGNINGRMCNGKFIHQYVASKYLETNASSDLYDKCIRGVKRLPFDNDGKVAIETVLYAAFENYGVAEGIIVPGTIEITVPDPDLFTAAQKATATWSGITGGATESGVVNKITASFVLAS